jgi:3-deoxy-D-manno-octulosonic-acid transferase/heptosyltransferase-1
MNILIVKLSAIGDVLHTLPALNALRHAFPQATITWLIEEAASELILGHEALDRVIVSKRKRWLKDVRGKNRGLAFQEIRAFVQELRDTRYDIILDFQALLKSAMLITLAKGDRKIGYGRGMEHSEESWLFLNERIPAMDMNIHALTRNLMMLAPLGIFSQETEYRLPITLADRDHANRLLSGTGRPSDQPVICINPVAKWETKLWRNDRFAQLADVLMERTGAAIVFTGAMEDATSIENIRHQMKHPSLSTAGQTTLKVLAAIYERSNLLVTTDTGPMHLCAAVNTPVVALFGPTAPWRTGPFGEKHRIIRAQLSCSPCFRRQCPTRACMDEIGVDQVSEQVEDLLYPQNEFYEGLSLA